MENENENKMDFAPNREENAGWISKLLILWFIPILRLSGKESKQSNGREEFVRNLGHIAAQDDPKLLYPKFEEAWAVELEKDPEQRSVFKVMLKIIGYNTLAIGFILSILQATASTGLPFVMKRLLLSLSDPTDTLVSRTEQWLCVAGMVLLPFIASICQAQTMYLSKRGSVRLYAVLTQAIFQKSLKLSCASRNKSSSGQIVNLMASDASTAIERAVMLIYPLFLAPIQIAIQLYLIYEQIGSACFAGIGVMFLVAPINVYIFLSLTKIYSRVVVHTDKRVNMVNEVIQAIRVLKMYAWENPFIKQIQKERDVELSHLRKHAYLYSVGLSAVFLQLPFLIQYAAFSTYYATDHIFYPWIIFTAIQLFQLMQQSLTQLPQALSQLSQTLVASRRIGKFLDLPELEIGESDSLLLHDDPVESCDTKIGEISIENATFLWQAPDIPEAPPKGRKRRKKKAPVIVEIPQADPEPTLIDFSLHVKAGEKIAVVGSVGSGKSSVIAAITGEMSKLGGSMSVRGSVALHAQKPFIVTGTVRSNILFGQPFDENRYQNVIYACCLVDDLKLLPKGDMCVIGERGINLSGGQKARIGLARAVYANKSIVLLDDPLSAVDAHVGADILKRCIHGKLLKGKTLVFVTNKIDKLDGFDQVILLEEGKVVKSGLPSAISQRKLMEIEREASRGRKESSDRASEKQEEDKLEEDKAMSNTDLYNEEEEETGTLKFSVLKFYVQSIGVFMFFAAYSLYCAYLFTPMLSQYVLSYWTDETVTCVSTGCIAPEGVDGRKWYTIYSSLLIGGFVLCVVAGVLIAEGRIHGSHKLHKQLLKSTMDASIPEFFDITPVGRILNRFSKDFSIIDIQLSQMFMFGIVCVCFVLSGFVGMILGTSFYFAALVIPIIIFYMLLYRYARRSAIVLQRVEAGSRAPIYSGFAEVLNGLQTIRAFHEQDRFFVETREKLTSNIAAFVLVRVALPACLTVGISIIGTIISASVSSFIVGTDIVEPGQAGLALTYAVGVSNSMNFAVFILTEVEVMMNSVERVKAYAENVQPEEPPINKSSGAISDISPEVKTKVVDSWPSQGEVVISNLTLGYRNGPDVIHGISLTIKPGEKVGVVGRTGSGKSSLLLGLLFVIKPRSGSIVVDGVDLSTISVHDLRSRIGIIPQDPVCFQGTIRFNLDPFGEHSDEALIDVLKTCSLGSFELDHEILEGGENVSVGQRQMICFGRAILRRSRLLMLDEATASVDHETDKSLQVMIRNVFADRTVITIAHRINTILDSDRVLVMKDGNVAEFDKPSVLLQKPDGIFKSMAKADTKQN